MNFKKSALLLAATAFLTASSFALPVALNAPSITPGSSPASGSGATAVYATGVVVTIAPGSNAVADGGTCYYTTDGSLPVSTTGVVSTTAAICDASPTVTLNVTGSATNGVAASTKIQAVEYIAGSTSFKDSATVSSTIKVQSTITTPTINPASSASDSAHVVVTDNWTTSAGAHPTIKYTLDGSNPATTGNPSVHSMTWITGGTGYPTIITDTTTDHLVLVATATGYNNSAQVSGTFGATSGGPALFIGSGSSAQAVEYALAMGGILGDGVGGSCGAHHFSLSNAAQAADTRSGVTPADTGNLVIVWDNSNDQTDTNVATGTVPGTAVLPSGSPYTVGGPLYPSAAAPSKVCVFLQLDSTLGVKAFMNSNLATPAEFLNITVSTGDTGSAISPFWNFCGTTGCTASATSTWAAGAVPDESQIPADVLAAVQGQPFNMAATDIRPEDAKFATTRALATLNATRTGLGYGPGPIGKAINSIAGSSFNVADFAVTVGSADPISHKLQQSYDTIAIGAAPVMVIVNKSAPTTTDSNFHFSNSTVKNISRFTLAGYLNGSITGTGALATSQSAVTDAPVHVWLREPLSGTYNTMEFNVPASKEIGSSQEIGITPAVATICTKAAGSTSAFFTGFPTTGSNVCTGQDVNGNSGNPLFITLNNSFVSTLGTVTTAGNMIGVNNATRARAIGTGEMVKQVALAPTGTMTGAYASGYNDALGYSFWGYGNIKSGNNHADTTTKYLTVDGVDPINATYANGSVPTCTAASYNAITGCPSNPTLQNVANGSYPIWSIYRAVVPAGTSTLATANGGQNLALVNSVITATATTAQTAYDFVPMSSMQVFRSHYLQAGVSPVNNCTGISGTSAPYSYSSCVTNGTLEAGGDVGGAVYTFQANIDHIQQYGSEVVNVKQ